MKTKFILNTIALIVLLLAGTTAFSQKNNKQPHNKEQRNKVAEAKKIYFQQELKLTDSESAKFWPIYDELHQKMRVNRKSERALGNELKNNIEQLSEAEAFSKSQQLFELQMAMIQLKKNYLLQFEQILGKKRAISVFVLEVSFRKELMQRLK